MLSVITPGQVWAKLTNEEVLKEVNLAVDSAIQELGLPGIQLKAEGIPFEALSDLESDPEGITCQTKLGYQRRAHIDEIASVKWMSRRKVWTSKAVSQHSSPCNMKKTTYI